MTKPEFIAPPEETLPVYPICTSGLTPGVQNRTVNCLDTSETQRPEIDLMRQYDEEGGPNGLVLHDRFLPEIFETILSYVPPDQLIHLSLVCKAWCRLIRTNKLWAKIFERSYKKKTKVYPWYVYYAIFTGKLEYDVLKDKDLYYHCNDCNCRSNENRNDSNSPIGCYVCYTNAPPCCNSGILDASRYMCSNKLPEDSHANLTIAADSLLYYIIDKHRPNVYVRVWLVAPDFAKIGLATRNNRYKGLYYTDRFQWGLFLKIDYDSRLMTYYWRVVEEAFFNRFRRIEYIMDNSCVFSVVFTMEGV